MIIYFDFIKLYNINAKENLLWGAAPYDTYNCIVWESQA